MRTILIASAAAVLLGFAAQAAPQNHVHVTDHPWCYDGTANASGVPICAYDSYKQCVANAAGQCIRNPRTY